MNLHLISVFLFGAPAITLFERHAPGENWYIFTTRRFANKDYGQLLVQPDHLPEVLEERAARNQLLAQMRERGVRKLFVHYLDEPKAKLAHWLKQRIDIEVNWIFYGADLYNQLYRVGRYELYDPGVLSTSDKFAHQWSRFKQAIRYKILMRPKFSAYLDSIDVFCFWNHLDYKLCVKSYDVNIAYKYFLNYIVIDLELPELLPKRPGSVLLNNSSDRTGNHLTMLKRIHDIDAKGDVEITIPLSYGDNDYAASVTADARKLFGNRIIPLTEFMPQKDYYNLLSGFAVAVFGHRRQQAAGNIFFLLAAGVKVFLRRDNNLLQWFREKDFLVYCVEEDLRTVADLRGLGPEEVAHNREVYLNTFSKNYENEMMEDILS